MPSKNKNLHAAKRAKNDEFYTQLTDIEKEMRHQKAVIVNPRRATVSIMVGVVLVSSLVPMIGVNNAYAKTQIKSGKPKITKVSNITKSSAKITWNKVAKAKGYQVRITKGARTVKTVHVHSKSYNVKGLSAKTTYKVKVRAYSTTKKYGKWSKAKTFKTKAAPKKVSTSAKKPTTSSNNKANVPKDVFSLGKLDSTPFVGHGIYKSFSYSLKTAEIRNTGYKSQKVLVIHYVATNISQGDAHYSNLNTILRAYQNGIKLTSASYVNGLDNDSNQDVSVEPGVSLQRWVTFYLRDDSSPVSLKVGKDKYGQDANDLVYSTTVKLK